MWRQNTFAENQESDQSISEDEGLGPDWPQDGISLEGPVDKKEGIHIQSQLEILRDTFDRRQTGFSIEDDVEIPVFHNECDFIFSPRRPPTCREDEAIVSDEEVKKNNVPSTLLITSGAGDLHKASPHSIQSERGDMAFTWSVINKEAEALVLLNENARCSSSHNASSKLHKSCQGGRGKAKPKFSFRFQSRKEDLSYAVNRNDSYGMSYNVVSLHEELETVAHRGMEHSTAELLEDFDGEKIEQAESLAIPAEVAVGHYFAEHSMAELLDGYQEKNAMLRVNYRMSSRTKGGRAQLIGKKSVSALGDRSVDDHDLPEALESGSSSDDELFKLPEANIQNLEVILPESKGKTMVDQFQEALGAACINDEDPLFALPGKSHGLFGKLQWVMRSEKERELGFLQNLQTGAVSDDEASCMVVKVLSRFLEAKLTVCRCFLSRSRESYHLAESCPIVTGNEERTLTVIFSSRVCNDLEFEVGDLIRIHSPWKEIRVPGRDEIIILSTCFSRF